MRTNESALDMSIRLLKIACIIFVIDLIWLATGGLYFRNMVSLIQAHPVVIKYAPLVIIYFALAYILSTATDIKTAGMLGIAVYAVYDMTNYALFKQYDVGIAVADIVWGGVLFVFSYASAKHFGLVNN
jgi:uncharacterized membrane protein